MISITLRICFMLLRKEEGHAYRLYGVRGRYFHLFVAAPICAGFYPMPIPRICRRFC
jgi:hypothetical protein